MSGVIWDIRIVARVKEKAETCYDVWFEHSGSDKKTEGRAVDPEIFIGSDQG